MVIPVAIHQQQNSKKSGQEEEEEEEEEKQVLFRIEKLQNGRINQKVLRSVVFEPLYQVEVYEEYEEEYEGDEKNAAGADEEEKNGSRLKMAMLLI